VADLTKHRHKFNNENCLVVLNIKPPLPLHKKIVMITHLIVTSNFALKSLKYFFVSDAKTVEVSFYPEVQP
jgi:hypothetical protein